MSIFLLHRISIQACDSGAGKKFLKKSFHFFCAFAEEMKMLASTSWTKLCNPLPIATVVTEKNVLSLMVSQRDATVLALNILPASSAEDKGKETSTV